MQRRLVYFSWNIDQSCFKFDEEGWKILIIKSCYNCEFLLKAVSVAWHLSHLLHPCFAACVVGYFIEDEDEDPPMPHSTFESWHGIQDLGTVLLCGRGKWELDWVCVAMGWRPESERAAWHNLISYTWCFEVKIVYALVQPKTWLKCSPEEFHKTPHSSQRCTNVSTITHTIVLFFSIKECRIVKCSFHIVLTIKVSSCALDPVKTKIMIWNNNMFCLTTTMAGHQEINVFQILSEPCAGCIAVG